VQAELLAEGDCGGAVLLLERVDRDLERLRRRQVDVGHRAVRATGDVVEGRAGHLAAVADQEVRPDRELRVHLVVEGPLRDPGRGGGGHRPAADRGSAVEHEGAVVHDVRAA
jgi:hypothetical protein